MTVKVQHFGGKPIRCNAYLVYAQGVGVLVDACYGITQEVEKFLKEKEISVRAILLTHAHVDHIGEVAALKAATNAPVYLHRAEAHFMQDPYWNQSVYFDPAGVRYPEADCLVEHGDLLQFGPITAEVLHTPGHTPGGVTYLIDGNAFTGDTLFRRTIGLVSCPGGNVLAEKHSIFHVLYQLPDDTRVYPGHGWPTTIWEERCYNPYARKLI